MNVPESIAMVSVVGIIGATLTSIVRALVSLRTGRRPAEAGAADARLARLEAAVDAVALEVERVAEGQRFTTHLLAERRATAGRADGGYREAEPARGTAPIYGGTA